MTIAIDATNILQGGGVTHLIELLKHSHPAEHRFDKIVIWSSALTLKKLPDYPWIIGRQKPQLNKSFFYRTLWKSLHLNKEIERERCNILFVPGGTDATGFHPMVTMSQNMLPFDLKEIKKFGIKPVALRLLALRFFQSRSFKKSNGVIFLTDYAEKVVKRSVYFEKNMQTAIIPHGVSKRFFIPPRPQVENYKTDKPIRLVYVSILDPYKHHEELLRAIEKLSKQFHLHLDLIGPKGFSASLVIKSIEELNIKSKKSFVKYHGAIPYDKLHNYYSNADIGIFASSCENMPNILLEMMAAGLPIACSNSGPMPEVLGDAGVYFNPESPDEIAEAISTLINSAELRRKLASTAHEKAKLYSWQRCADETFKFLNDVYLNYKQCAAS